MTTEAHKKEFLGRATIYLRSELYGNIHKLEVKHVRFWRGPFAQYSNAVCVEYLATRQRHFRRITEGSCFSILILEGWNHPSPDSLWGPNESSAPDVAVFQLRYPSFDPRWRIDFDRLIANHITKTQPRIVVDFRAPQEPLDPSV